MLPAENPAIQADGLPPAADDEDALLSDLLASAGGSGDVGAGRGQGRGKGRGRGCGVAKAKASAKSRAKAKAKPSPKARAAPVPDDAASTSSYKAGEFNVKRVAYVKQKRQEGMMAAEAQQAWMQSDERLDLVSSLPFSQQKRRRFC